MWRRAGRTRSMQDWKPMCRGCGYDLGGLQDGACPECGRKFTLLALRMAAEIEADTRRSDWMSRSRVAGVVFWVAFLVSLGQLHPSQVIHAARHAEWIQPIDAASEAVLIAVAWIAGLAWMAVARVSVGSGRVVLVWLPPLVLRTGVSVLIVSSWERVLVAPWLVVAAWVVVRMPRVERRRVAGVTSVLLSAGLALMGGAMLLSPPQSPGSPWSIWRDPRWGQEHDQFPLTVRESRWLGGAALLVSAAAIGVMVWRFVRHSTRPGDATGEQGGAKLADAAASEE